MVFPWKSFMLSQNLQRARVPCSYSSSTSQFWSGLREIWWFIRLMLDSDHACLGPPLLKKHIGIWSPYSGGNFGLYVHETLLLCLHFKWVIWKCGRLEGPYGREEMASQLLLLPTPFWRTLFLGSWRFDCHPRLQNGIDLCQSQQDKSPRSKHSESKGKVISLEGNLP